MDWRGEEDGEWLKGEEVPEGAPDESPEGGAFSRSSCCEAAVANMFISNVDRG